MDGWGVEWESDNRKVAEGFEMGEGLRNERKMGLGGGSKRDSECPSSFRTMAFGFRTRAFEFRTVCELFFVFFFLRRKGVHRVRNEVGCFA